MLIYKPCVYAQRVFSSYTLMATSAGNAKDANKDTERNHQGKGHEHGHRKTATALDNGKPKTHVFYLTPNTKHVRDTHGL